MAIYDWNGSAHTEIKAVYDWNGSAHTQINRAYDWNGSADALVYKRSEIIYPGQTVQGAASGGSWYSFGAKSIAVAGGWAQAYIVLNLTNIESITFTYYVYKMGNSQIFLGAAEAFNVKPSTMAGYPIIQNAGTQTESYTTTGTVNLVDSMGRSPSGNYYVGTQVYTDNTSSAVELQVQKIVVTYK